ncbi:hypothetical protein GCM10009760_26290 [Kitasatospora kazusensis]|uniref:Resolvase/invertase-type recombinase catalytic domain-containing protein n=2 Tax=Kitasatospora kazusensis TaxID=407974 RepID=A0ABP5L6X0_9ACTN
MISPEVQVESIDGLAKRAGIVQVAEPIQDLGLSGRDFAKRQIGKIVRMVQDGKVDVVMLWKWSRFGRNVLESLQNIQLILDAGGQIMAATEDFDGRTSVGRLQITQMLGWAQFQSDQIGEGWQNAGDFRRRAGLPHSGFKAFGYKLCETCPPVESGTPRNKCAACRDGILKIDQLTGPILADVYRRVAFLNEPIHSVVRDLRSRGIRSTRGGVMDTQAVYKVLDSGFGLGWVRWRSKEKMAKDAGSRSSRPEAFDIWQRGAHDPVIEDEAERDLLWLMYLAKRGDAPTTPKGHFDPKYSVSGLMRCHRCERNMAAYSLGKAGDEKYPRLPNGDRDPHNVKFLCQRGSVILKDCVGSGSMSLFRIENEVLEWLLEQAQGEESVPFKIKQIAGVKARQDRDDERITRRLSELRGERSRLVQGYIKQIIPEENYLEEKEKLDAELAELEASAATPPRIEYQRPPAGHFTTLAEEWKHMSYSRKRQALSMVISHIYAPPISSRSERRIRVVPLWEVGEAA